MYNIYDLIEEIKQRPRMYVLNKSLLSLQYILHGYCTCLDFNDVKETYEGREFVADDFGDWYCRKIGSHSAFGWAITIERHISDPDEAWDTFFELVAQYRFGKGSS